MKKSNKKNQPEDDLAKRILEESEKRLEDSKRMNKLIDELEARYRAERSQYDTRVVQIHPSFEDQFFTYCLN